MSASLKKTNAARTGNGTARGGIVLAELGKRYATIYHALKDFRRALEKRVAGPGGSIDLLTVGKINEALRWEMTARVQQRLIVDNPAMPPAEVISALNGIGNATRNRNAIMAKLLDGKTAAAAVDPWKCLDESEPEPDPPPADTSPSPPADRAADATAAVPAAGIPRLDVVNNPPAERNGKISTHQNFPVQQNSTGGNSTAENSEEVFQL